MLSTKKEDIHVRTSSAGKQSIDARKGNKNDFI